jgi:peptidoglycan/LPS O-acetylase OafA/YrhL
MHMSQEFKPSTTYRRDIDGLRAVAVVAVVLFHFGLLPSGYLGVDVFFVISGYLVTTIVLSRLRNDSFSLFDFYVRRIRRILPLSFCICLVVLVVGSATMLPDDLENLAASVVATNLFSNNILQAITTRDYWDVVNEYKPLLHTWSLGVEEQYYLAYPLYLVWAAKRGRQFALRAIGVLAAGSLVLFWLPAEPHVRFYWLPYRLFEMAFGGLAAIATDSQPRRHGWTAAALVALLALLCAGTSLLPGRIALLAVVALSTAIVASANGTSKFARTILENRLAVGLGLISYGIYMWHQPVLAFARYCLFPQLHATHLAGISVLILTLAITTYYVVESPFRNPRQVGTPALFTAIATMFLLSMGMAGDLYRRAGVIRDVPELGISASGASDISHSDYNARIWRYDKPFAPSDRTRVLIVGNSFARDWANVLLESDHARDIEISYVFNADVHPEFHDRAADADVIFFSSCSTRDVDALGVQSADAYGVGPKNFGASSGIFYNYRGNDYFGQRTQMLPGILEHDTALKHDWGNRFISLIDQVIDVHQTVPVFTPDHMFISVDCRHFTQAGARMFASLLRDDLRRIFHGHVGGP